MASEFHLLKEREIQNCKNGVKWVNGISYNQRTVNVVEFIMQESQTERRFQWITNLEITKKKAELFVITGRKRWKIENKKIVNFKKIEIHRKREGKKSLTMRCG